MLDRSGTSGVKLHHWKTMALGLVAFMVVGFGPSLAFADDEPTEEEGLMKLRTANDAFDDEDFDTAYEYYVKAYEILEIPMIKYRMGQTAEKTDRVELAIEHYEAYREIGDDEEFLGRIDEALPELREQMVVTVELVSDPEGALVTIGDEELGETPRTVERDAGEEVEFEFALEGYETATAKQVLQPGEDPVVEVTLVPEDDLELEPMAQLDPAMEVDTGPAFGLWGWTSTGLGASLLALGGVLTFFQMDATDEVNSLDRSAHAAGSPDEWNDIRQQQEALREDANNYHRAAMGAYIAGGLMTAAGLGLLTFDAFSGDDGGPELGVNGGVGPAGGFVTIDGRF